MGAQLDLDDVASTSELAKRELKALRDEIAAHRHVAGFADQVAMELETLLSAGPEKFDAWSDSAYTSLDAYNKANDAAFPQYSPTFMGEPVLPLGHNTERSGAERPTGAPSSVAPNQERNDE